MKKKRHALVLSGGASLGAFQAGFLCAENKKYDAVFGASIGALNGLYAAMGDYKGLEETWQKIAKNRSIAFKSKIIKTDGSLNYFRLVWEIIIKFPLKSLATWSGLDKIIEFQLLKGRPKSSFFFDVTRMDDYDSISLNSADYTDEDLASWLTVSASMPAIFPVYEGYADGGIGSKSTLSNCVEWIMKNYDMREWHIDIIQTYNPDIFQTESKTKGVVMWAIRLFEIMLRNNKQRDSNLFLQKNNSFTYRKIIPEINLGNPLDFSKESIEKRFRHGAEIAKTV